MNERLFPLSLAEVLDRTAQLYRSHFLVFFGVALIPVGTVLLLAAAPAALTSAWTAHGVAPGGLGSVMLSLSMLGFLGVFALPVCLGATVLGWAAMTHAAAEAFLGRPVSIGRAYGAAWRRGWSYLWLSILEVLLLGLAPVLVFAAALLLAIGLAAAGVNLGSPVLGFAGAGLMVLFAGGLAVFTGWMLLRICLAQPACVFERISAWRAIGRSAVLSRGTRGRIVLLFLLVLALAWVLSIALMFPLFVALALIPAARNPQNGPVMAMIFMFSLYAVMFLTQALTKPVYGIALTLFYFDQRIRTEGFDIVWMMEEAGMAAPPAPEPVPWLAPTLPRPEAALPELGPSLPNPGDPA